MPLYVCILAVASILYVPAHADSPTTEDHAYNWRRAVEVDEVRIEMHQVSTWELRAVKREYGEDRRRSRSPGLKAESRHQGFAVLFRGPDGYRCEVYYSDARERVTSHEERHCYGWTH